MPLQLDNLKKSLHSLHRSIAVFSDFSGSSNLDLIQTLQAGVIQNFEIAYEQCWKMMQRWIRINKNDLIAENPLSRRDLFRLAAEYGLIRDPVRWFGFGEARNQTSHIYHAQTANTVFASASEFTQEAEDFLTRLENAND